MRIVAKRLIVEINQDKIIATDKDKRMTKKIHKNFILITRKSFLPRIYEQ